LIVFISQAKRQKGSGGSLPKTSRRQSGMSRCAIHLTWIWWEI